MYNHKPKLFYCTFGYKYAMVEHPTHGSKIHPDGIVGIYAKDINEAYARAFATFGEFFCTLYYPEKLEMDLFPLGVLFTIGDNDGEN
jgi:hypothetical protein